MGSHANLAGAGEQAAAAVSWARTESKTDALPNNNDGGACDSDQGQDDLPASSAPQAKWHGVHDDDDDDDQGQEEEEEAPMGGKDCSLSSSKSATVPPSPPPPVPPSLMSPPYWQNTHPSHRRSGSEHSSESELPVGAITLLDNEAADDGDGRRVGGGSGGIGGGDRHRNEACWAKSVEVTDYIIVNGGATNIGAFVVWTVRVETLHGCYMDIRKRYSEFDDLRHRLVKSFPNFDAAVPTLPPKSVLYRFRPTFLEKRRAGLQYFLK